MTRYSVLSSMLPPTGFVIQTTVDQNLRVWCVYVYTFYKLGMFLVVISVNNHLKV